MPASAAKFQSRARDRLHLCLIPLPPPTAEDDNDVHDVNKQATVFSAPSGGDWRSLCISSRSAPRQTHGPRPYRLPPTADFVTTRPRGSDAGAVVFHHPPTRARISVEARVLSVFLYLLLLLVDNFF